MGRVDGRTAAEEWAGRKLVVNECVWMVWVCAAQVYRRGCRRLFRELNVAKMSD